MIFFEALTEFFRMAVCRPDFEINKDMSLAQLTKWIKSDLDSSIPLLEAEYERIVSQTDDLADDPFFKKNFVQDEHRSLLMSNILQTALIETPDFGGSEANQQSQYDLMFANIIRKFVTVMPSLKIDRNVYEKESDCTDNTKKPDFLLYFLQILIMWGEEKILSNGGLKAATQDLVDKLGVMSSDFYGDIPFLFAYSACNNRFQMYAISRFASEPWHQLFDLSLASPVNRAKLIVYTFKLMRLIKLYEPLIEKIGLNDGKVQIYYKLST